ncbi:methyltransferase domain-containing protein [Ferrigenium sp. UT5]|uniref:methyltransferase domain-containing protein n=1 Tax=Ferrigenium sp. UT5 TaxID=3242105 RepID=UPI0035539C78
MAIYRKFIRGGVPEYLARYYWWAYLWDKSIWFFDHQPIINAILFGQYDTLLNKTLAQVERKPGARLLQLTCVYGKLTPSLLHHTDNEVHLCDVATGQLALARGKTTEAADRCLLARMNAESLGYAQDTFDQVILFFLFHEMPPQARQHVYDEIARVVKRGGSVLITEYGSTPERHLLYRFPLTRWVLGRMEPFLPGFWQEDVQAKLNEALLKQGKRLAGEPQVEHCFANFYRVMRFDLNA